MFFLITIRQLCVVLSKVFVTLDKINLIFRHTSLLTFAITALLLLSMRKLQGL